MFNLAEKKAFMADLVCKVVGEGSKSWNRTLEPDHCLAQELLRLEDLALFKMQDFRLLFVAKCLHLHSMSGQVHTILGRNSFDLITDMFRVILREGNNDGDFLAVRMVYQAAALFGIYVGEHVKTVLMTLRKHEAWRNPELWSATLDDLVARDKQRWMALTAPLTHVMGRDVSSDQLIKLMIFFRLRALVRAMLELRTPSETIDSLVSRCRDAHAVEFSCEDVSQSLDPSASLWVLDLAGKAHALPPVAGRVTPDPTDELAEVIKNLKTQSTATIQVVVRWASEATSRAAHGSCLGYSARQELLRFALERIASDPPRLWAAACSPPKQTNVPKVASPRARTCLCGRPYGPWKLVGGYAPAQHSLLSLPSFTCEDCFRRATSQRSLNLETTDVHEGTLVATLHLPASSPCPPQSVGCVAIPHATLRTPATLAAFWTPPEKAAPHRRKNSRDRLAKKGHQSSDVDNSSTPVTSAAAEPGPTHTRAPRSVEKEFKSILELGIEVLKHGRMGRPHLRTVFLDGPSNQIIWCSKEDTVSPATMRASGRGGVQLESLKEVKVINEKRRCLTLAFKERPLTIEATSQEQFEFILEGFNAIVAANRLELEASRSLGSSVSSRKA